jgi:L,D-peptidoglycan transpeptidase YkuD (ErfK/YbiS/YcfS/YnhG family)
MSQRNFTAWAPNDYVPNVQTDRDLACARMRTTYVVGPNSKASYQYNRTNPEDSFCNSIAQPKEFNDGRRFQRPDKFTTTKSNKTRFEGFQA